MSLPLKKQQFPVPRGTAEAAYHLHVAMFLQMLPGMFAHVPAHLKALEMVKVRAPKLPKPAGRRAVALPGLRLQQKMLAKLCQSWEQPQQASVAVVQVDPHGDGQAQGQVKAGAVVTGQVFPQRRTVTGDVQQGEGDAALVGFILLGSPDEGLVQIQAQ